MGTRTLARIIGRRSTPRQTSNFPAAARRYFTASTSLISGSRNVQVLSMLAN
jgi:hypothetical protein